MDDVKAKLDEFEQRLNAINKRFDDMQWVVGAIIIFFGIVITASSGLAVYLFKDQGDAQEKMSAQLQSSVKEQNDKLSQDEKDIKKESEGVLDHASADAGRQTQFVSDYVSGTRSDVNTWIQRSREDYKRLEDKVDEGYGDPKLDIFGPDNRPIDGGTLDANYDETTDRFGSKNRQIQFEVRLRNSGTGPSGPVSLRAYSNEVRFVQPSDDLTAGQSSDVLYPNAIYENEWTANAGLPGGGFTAIGNYNLAVKEKVLPGPYHVVIRIYYNPHKSSLTETKFILMVH